MSRYDEFLELQAQETDDCILWPYGRSGVGYGQVWLGGGKVYTHRLSCERAHGAPPTPQHTDAAHSCRNRHCINPRHLRWATRSENMTDKRRDGTDPIGERNPHTHLTEFDVAAIRHYVSCGTMQKVLVSHYGVSKSSISEIISRKNWGHV